QDPSREPVCIYSPEQRFVPKAARLGYISRACHDNQGIHEGSHSHRPKWLVELAPRFYKYADPTKNEQAQATGMDQTPL
ncbi:hypothetical protein GW17_00008487, partial [Ensete ventricosum]